MDGMNTMLYADPVTHKDRYTDAGILAAMPCADCDYVRARDGLIRDAERAANRDCHRFIERTAWDLAFLGHMDRLARERGIVR